MSAAPLRLGVAGLGTVGIGVVRILQAEAALIAARPYDSQIPLSYDAAQPAPLVLLLHGYMASGTLEKIFFGLGPLVDAAGILLAYPDGTADSKGNLFWNATDACCNFFDAAVDDSAYLTALVAAIDSTLGVDPHRIYFVGHSNGGFMSYRFACDHADRVAAVVSIAGATFDDPSNCAPLRPVSTLQIHGTSDAVIQYGGGTLPGGDGPYPAAAETASAWAAYNGCESSAVSLAPFDGLDGLPGEETGVERYASGCSGAVTELWTVTGGQHSPAINDSLRDRVIAFLVDAGNRVFEDGFETGFTFAWSSSDGEL